MKQFEGGFTGSTYPGQSNQNMPLEFGIVYLFKIGCCYKQCKQQIKHLNTYLSIWYKITLK